MGKNTESQPPAEEQDAGTLDTAQVKKILNRIKNGIRITKVTATRSVKSPRGDHFVGFSAQYESVQDDGSGPGEDLVGETASGEGAIPVGSLSLKEARLAAALVQMQADICAIEHAHAGGDLKQGQRNDEVKRIKGNFGRLIMDIMGV
jgi:hypothetical protein